MTAPPPYSQAEKVCAGVILLLAAALRLWALDDKPAHFDEGVNGHFVDEMTATGFYHYDPSNFHGPLHFYALFVAQTLLGRSEWVLRLPVALLGIACVAVVLNLRTLLAGRACLLAAAAMAVSPGFVFYGRYAIHETWQVFFLLVALWGVAGLRAQGLARHRWAIALSLAGLVATKETWIIHLVAAGLAVPTVWLVNRILGAPVEAEGVSDRAWLPWLPPAAVALAAIGALYSGFGLDPSGLAGFGQAFAIWFRTGTDELTGHEKSWAYWLELMVRYEWPVLAGLLLSPWAALRAPVNLLRWLAIAAGGTLCAYTIIAYKTPWCLISFAWPFLLLWGWGMDRALVRMDRWTAGTAAAALLAGTLVLCVRLSFLHPTDELEPYAYVQSGPDVATLRDTLRALVRRHPVNGALAGVVLLPSADGHPLPWLLGDYPSIVHLPLEDHAEAPLGDLILVENPYAAFIETRLLRETPPDQWFRRPFVLRGSWGTEATLYLRASRFAAVLPGEVPAELQAAEGEIAVDP